MPSYGRACSLRDFDGVENVSNFFGKKLCFCFRFNRAIEICPFSVFTRVDLFEENGNSIEKRLFAQARIFFRHR